MPFSYIENTVEIELLEEEWDLKISLASFLAFKKWYNANINNLENIEIFIKEDFLSIFFEKNQVLKFIEIILNQPFKTAKEAIDILINTYFENMGLETPPMKN